METLIQWISLHAEHAHWFLFGAILLAGLNIPISLDILIVASALLAAQVIPEHTTHLYLATFLGCYFSAWLAYWLGRLGGSKILKISLIKKMLPSERIEKIQRFYNKHGLLTLLIGRFIPFGIRNCIFLTTGISRMSFIRFACYDLIASFTWSAILFYSLYSLSLNYESLADSLKVVNLAVFAAFSVTVIGFIWYKKRKKKLAKTPQPHV